MVINGHIVKIGKPNGPYDGMAIIDSHRAIPLGLCAAAAGRDAWMRQIPVECRSCGETFKLADSDSHEHCQKCYDEFGEENRIADGRGAG